MFTNVAIVNVGPHFVDPDTAGAERPSRRGPGRVAMMRAATKTQREAL